jgi:two-component system LytT family response regulator
MALFANHYDGYIRSMEGRFFSELATNGFLQIGNRLCVKSGLKIEFIKTESIYWIEACDQYIRIYCSGPCCRSRVRISDLDGRLEPTKFLRIHRCAIVNLQHVREVLLNNRKECYAILNDGTKLRVSRHRKEILFSALGVIPILEPPKREAPQLQRNQPRVWLKPVSSQISEPPR